MFQRNANMRRLQRDRSAGEGVADLRAYGALCTRSLLQFRNFSSWYASLFGSNHFRTRQGILRYAVNV